jgi:hypothetical protein
VQKEVERLLQAGAIRELHYPTWLSNTVAFIGRISKWGAKIGALDVKYLPRTAIKGQILADFVIEFTPALEHKELNMTAFQEDFTRKLRVVENTRGWGFQCQGIRDRSCHNNAR